MSTKQRFCLDCKNFIGYMDPRCVKCRKCKRECDLEYNRGYIQRKKNEAKQDEREMLLKKLKEHKGDVRSFLLTMGDFIEEKS